MAETPLQKEESITDSTDVRMRNRSENTMVMHKKMIRWVLICRRFLKAVNVRNVINAHVAPILSSTLANVSFASYKSSLFPIVRKDVFGDQNLQLLTLRILHLQDAGERAES